MDESAVGTKEDVGRGFTPIRLHAGGAGRLEAHPPPAELVPRAVEAAEVSTLDLDAGGFGRLCAHGMGFFMIGIISDTTNQSE